MSVATQKHPAFEVINLAHVHDAYQLERINKIHEKQQEINVRLDRVLNHLKACQSGLQDVDAKEIDIDMLQTEEEEIRKLFADLGIELPPFSTELSCVPRTEVENFVAKLESGKRRLQSEVPELVSELELTVQNMVMIINMLRDTLGKLIALGEHVTRKMSS